VFSNLFSITLSNIGKYFTFPKFIFLKFTFQKKKSIKQTRLRDYFSFSLLQCVTRPSNISRYLRKKWSNLSRQSLPYQKLPSHYLLDFSTILKMNDHSKAAGSRHFTLSGAQISKCCLIFFFTCGCNLKYFLVENILKQRFSDATWIKQKTHDAEFHLKHGFS